MISTLGSIMYAEAYWVPPTTQPLMLGGWELGLKLPFSTFSWYLRMLKKVIVLKEAVRDATQRCMHTLSPIVSMAWNSQKIPRHLDHKGVSSATQYASDVQTSFDNVLISSPLSHQCTDNSILLHMTLLGVSVPDRKKMDWMQKHMFFSVLSKHVQLVWFYLKCCEYV